MEAGPSDWLYIGLGCTGEGLLVGCTGKNVSPPAVTGAGFEGAGEATG